MRFWIALGVLGTLALFPACNSALDDADSADVVLQVMTITGQAVQSQDDGSGTCTFTIQEWTAQLRNEPKNSLATQSPFGDIRMIRIDVAYDWGLDGVVDSTTSIGLSGTVPAAGNQSVTFFPVSLEELTGRDGQSANMDMLFVGETYDGNPVSVRQGKLLVVNSCIVAGP
jgi:hypothetical protein